MAIKIEKFMPLCGKQVSPDSNTECRRTQAEQVIQLLNSKIRPREHKEVNLLLEENGLSKLSKSRSALKEKNSWKLVNIDS